MDIKTMDEKMHKTLSFLRDEYNHLKAGRANPLLLDKVTVNYYGTETPLKQLASISVPEPRMIQVQPYDATALKDMEHAIQAANLGMNPSNDGKVIRLVLPMLTEERRVELTKEAKKMGEEAKVAVRNLRRDALEHIKKQEKEKEITEDEKSNFEMDVQKKVDDVMKELEKIVEEKCKEIMEV